MKKYYYLVHIQYLGFRFHGWQKQPGVKTVASMMEKTLAAVLGHLDFKLLGCSRTDAMVSACHSAFELFLPHPVDPIAFSDRLNSNLPNDIRVLNTEPVSFGFNIIQAPRTKEYVYLFAFGEKPHPFSAPMVATFQGHLDVFMMKQGAALFKGIHDFGRYCTKPGPASLTNREVLDSYIEENRLFSADFFPQSTFAYRIRGRGFMRNQVRLIMGQLIRLGRHEITMADIVASLDSPSERPLPYIAPASGLILYKIHFDACSL